MYYKRVNKNNNKEMFNFLKTHYRYYTLNSWNVEKSIANNIKVYNIDEFTGIEDKILQVLERDNYNSINDEIEAWEFEQGHCWKVGFNGRSGGYLVLYNNDNYCSVLDDYIENNNNYEDFLQDIKNSGYSAIKNYHYRLVQQVEMVQMFDKLCDKLVQICLYLVDMQNIRESE